MTTTPTSHRRLTDRLGFQLAFVLAAVLLPLTFISLSKSITLVNEVQARSEAALLGETMQAAAGEVRLIQEARGVAEALSNSISPLLDNDVACSRVMARIAERNLEYSLVAFVPNSGLMRCSSTGVEFDFSKSPLFQQIMAAQQPGFTVNPHSQVTGNSVLGVTYPVRGQDGTVIGIVSVSLPHEELGAEIDDNGASNGLTLFTFDPDGQILTSSAGLDDLTALPGDLPLEALASAEPLAFSTEGRNGKKRVYSVVPMVPGELYALGTRLTTSSGALGRLLSSMPVLLPALMWLASLVAAWLAVERLVSRNVRKLSKSIKSFAHGNRVVGDIEVRQAPLEIREMAEAYESMTDTILRDEAELEDTIHQKEVLLREVHHRVKNNLQLIASIMNMQVRRVKSKEARQMMVELRDRVMSLATIHRELFETVGSVDIHADELLKSVVDQITSTSSANGRLFECRTEFDDIRMVPDQAVPLGLLVAETLSSALNHCSTEAAHTPKISVVLRRMDEDTAVVEVINSTTQLYPDPGLPTDLGGQLISAFAMQLGGRVDRDIRGGLYRTRVEFGVSPLSEAEMRFDRPAEPA
ncbi:sensor histidine kinase [Pseudoruegeria sp. SK021]|uniref:sensor histidine kinase n=1 Tax=Pseudoruegeria sp. SK021 TaxID=1933035 RepID=UPI000A23B494|nr:sensor histidine kinase [Pseudoruegeria sp. SK021]OSP54427.1 hypothetical protein BV911_12560 [Pseudoruegeria sp. SK021]